jgi:hypothetical protein
MGSSSTTEKKVGMDNPQVGTHPYCKDPYPEKGLSPTNKLKFCNLIQKQRLNTKM